MSERNVKKEEKQKLKEKWALRSQGDPTHTVWVQPELFKSFEAHAVFWSLTTHILEKLTRRLAWAKSLSVWLESRDQACCPQGRLLIRLSLHPSFWPFLTFNCFFTLVLKEPVALRKEGWVSSSCLAWFMSRFCPCKSPHVCWWQTAMVIWK